MIDRQLLAELLTERLALPSPPPKPVVRRPEPADVTAQRRRELVENLNPEPVYETRPDPLAYAVMLGGRICDLPGDHLDMLARRVSATEGARRRARYSTAKRNSR